MDNRFIAALFAGLFFAPGLASQDRSSASMERCVNSCMLEVSNPELQRQELVTLEKESAKAVQHQDGTFFRRVYSDDFVGILSHGQAVNKLAFIQTIEGADVRFESVSASDISVHVYRDTAIATCLWSIRMVSKGQSTSTQIRVIHVYLYGQRGFHVVSSQATLLPPFGSLPI
jgi:ketosteroid isomerase-like protein